jgi:hypothetical protein
MYSPAVPPTLAALPLSSFILNAENGRHYCGSHLQLQGEFMTVPAGLHLPPAL